MHASNVHPAIATSRRSCARLVDWVLLSSRRWVDGLLVNSNATMARDSGLVPELEDLLLPLRTRALASGAGWISPVCIMPGAIGARACRP